MHSLYLSLLAVDKAAAFAVTQVVVVAVVVVAAAAAVVTSSCYLRRTVASRLQLTQCLSLAKC